MKLPQLSLRDLFWLVLVSALAVGWWVRDSRISKQLNAAEAELEATRAELAAAQSANGNLREYVSRLTIELMKPGTLHSNRRAVEKAWQRIKSRLDPETRAKVEASEEQEAALEIIRLQGIRTSATENDR